LPRTALAANLLAEGRAVEAQATLEGALRVDPSDVHTNMLLGDARAVLGDVAGAREAYGHALDREPGDLATLLALARLERRGGRSDDAASALERALLVDPDCAEAHRVLSEVSGARGDPERAVLHLWAARRLDPKPGDGEALVDYYRLLIEKEERA